ncbi:hypothetical protein [Paenibacillus lautus]|uniref:hypothetical protein n=1 Tax=Paenibacillus lautus TaxID=1401 RepID=UPI003D2E1E1C
MIHLLKEVGRGKRGARDLTYAEALQAGESILGLHYRIYTRRILAKLFWIPVNRGRYTTNGRLCFQSLSHMKVGPRQSSGMQRLEQ